MPDAESILVIPDIHNKVDLVDQLLKELRYHYSTVLFLGDYFDDYGDGPDEVAHTARWLADSLEKPNRVHLLGNHDLPYLFPGNPQLNCPGFSAEKWVAATPFLEKARLDRLKLAHYANGWLYSHAGFHPELTEGAPAEFLERKANRILRGLSRNRPHPWLEGSPARGCWNARVPGITWMDWGEFEPIPGLNQIVGHTPDIGRARGQHVTDCGFHDSPRACRTGDGRKLPGVTPRHNGGSCNWCVDTGFHLLAFVFPKGMEFWEVG